MQQLISLLSERLNAVRKQTGLSQVEFAQRIGVSPRAYKNYELGLRDVPLAVVTGICREFSVDLNWLVLGTGAASQESSDAIIRKTVFGIRSFEKANDLQFSDEKMAAVFSYMFSQMANGRDYSEADIHAYLKTTL